MPALSMAQAVEKLANGVEKAEPIDLPEIYSEIYPEELPSMAPTADEIAELIRNGLEAEVIVDLWNVVFPDDRHVWYDEEMDLIHYNDVMVGYED